MTFKQKEIRTLSGAELDQVTEFIHGVLYEATVQGTSTLGCSGASFITSSIGLWMRELAELDAKSTTKLFSALATISDPSKSIKQKEAAEIKRRAAATALMRAADLAGSVGTSVRN